jgi:acyl-CoA synthetase (NDP forming)
MLDALFRPKTVAVIGASTKELSIGNRVIRNLIDFDFKGEIYPINPKADEIRGIKAYPSILDVPADQVDVVHMVIPARFVPQAVEDCAVKKVKHIIINSGGFAEIGPEGAAIRKTFLRGRANTAFAFSAPTARASSTPTRRSRPIATSPSPNPTRGTSPFWPSAAGWPK